MASPAFTAITHPGEISRTLADWRAKFAAGAEVTGRGKEPVYWHRGLPLWGRFGWTRGRGGQRPYNVFGTVQGSVSSNMIVEINQPVAGIDTSIQAIFARDGRGRRWVLHQGRMKVRGKAITEQAFIDATGLSPVTVRLDGSAARPYHPVAPIDGPAGAMLDGMARFVGHCARARLIATAPADLREVVEQARGRSASLRPETAGTFWYGARDGGIGHRWHGDICNALAAEIAELNPQNGPILDRYAPDLFTVEPPPILFEIKTSAHPAAVYEGAGQLQLYGKILEQQHGAVFRKVLVVPRGMGRGLAAALEAVGVVRLDYDWDGSRATFVALQLKACLAR